MASRPACAVCSCWRMSAAGFSGSRAAGRLQRAAAVGRDVRGQGRRCTGWAGWSGKRPCPSERRSIRRRARLGLQAGYLVRIRRWISVTIVKLHHHAQPIAPWFVRSIARIPGIRIRHPYRAQRQGANRRLFYSFFRTRSITMTMIRGTRFIVGNRSRPDPRAGKPLPELPSLKLAPRKPSSPPWGAGHVHQEDRRQRNHGPDVGLRGQEGPPVLPDPRSHRAFQERSAELLGRRLERPLFYIARCYRYERPQAGGIGNSPSWDSNY